MNCEAGRMADLPRNFTPHTDSPSSRAQPEIAHPPRQSWEGVSSKLLNKEEETSWSIDTGPSLSAWAGQRGQGIVKGNKLR